MASQHIRACLFFIELSAAIGISMLTLVLLRVLHCGSWSVRLSSTFALLWIIKAVANFFRSEAQKNDLGKSENDATNRNYQDVLKNFEVREQRNNIHFEEQRDKYDDASKSPLNKQSAMMIETKEFLGEEAEGQDNAKISFSLISILAAVFLQLAIRLLVIAQNFTLTFRRRRTPAAGRHGLKALLYIPFTIGRSLSPSGVSFYIFSFLNNFLGGEGFDAEDDGDEMAMKALSFDHISTNSSSIWIRPLRKHSSTKCQRSWLGLCFGDIELSLTLLLRRKRKHADSDTNPCIRSVTIQMKINSFAVGLFPRVFDWVECNGVTIDASAAIDSNNTTGSKSFGVSLHMSKLHMYQVASTLRKIVSWGKVDVSCEANNRRTTVAVLSVPGGFAAIGNSMEMHLDGKVAMDSIVSKKTVVHLGSSLGNRIAAGINLEELPSFMQTLEILLKNMSSCFDKSNLVTQKVSNTAPSKPKSSIQLIELCVSSNIHAYTILSSSNRLVGRRDVLSFRVADAFAVLKGESDVCTNALVNDELLRCRIGAGMLRYEVTDDSAPALDLVSIKEAMATLKYIVADRASQRDLSVNIGGMVVRVGANDVMELSSCVKIGNEIKLASTRLQNDLKQFKLGYPANDKQNAEAKIAKRKQNDLDWIEILVDDADVIVELNSGFVREGSVVANDDRVRFAVLLRKVRVSIVGQRRLSTPGPSECDSTDADPRKLFGSKLCTHGASFLIETAASCVEAFVTYSPHMSLPVFDCNHMNVPNEVSFYAQASTFGLQTIVPSRTTRLDATTLLTKAMLITFDEVSLFERAPSGIGVMSLFATSVHEFHFNPNESPWAMINTYNRISPLHLTKIAQGTGEFCLTESRNHNNNEVERDETISVRLRKGSSDVELAWSPVFQWIQMSFNKRLQAALDYLRRLIVSNEKGSSVIPIRQNTRVYVGVDSNVTARMNMFVGVKSTVLLAIDGGFDVTISITKYPSVHPPVQLKPSICLQAGHIEAYLNGIQSPILITDGFVFQNTIRRALKHEIDEYIRKKETNPTKEDIQNEIVTDIDGHPLKEIFHLNIGTCATVKLPPSLFLGDVIDDFNLLPKSLDIGMNSLKEDGDLQKRVKRYQLLIIECIIPSLSISLLDVDIDAENPRLRDEVSLFIEAGKLTIERNTPPELTQEKLNNIDEDNYSRYSYGPVVQGGDMKLSISHLMFNVHPLTIAAPMVRIGNFSINGCLFLAGLSPTTPGIKENVNVNYRLLWHHRGNCCCPYGVSVDASGIPVKVYTDSIIHCDELDVNYGPVMGPSMPRLQECFKRILPPPKDDGGQDPLTWWDNIRFAVHGPIALCVDKLSFRWLLDSHIFQDKSIYLTCDDCTLDYKESFSVDAINVDVSMPGVPYDTSMHPSESFNETDFCLPHQMESMVGKGRHPLLFVPQLSTKMTFLWKMLNPGKQPYQHHSIYLNCEDSAADKFACFRSDGYFVDLSFELPGGMAGSDDVCNWIALRIDVLPWFTHLNSTVDYSSLHDDERQDPIPKFLSLAMNININQLKVAAWYEGEEAADSMTDGGLCLIVRQVEYKATLDDVKEIVLGGPVKAARLNVSGFTQPDKNEESGSMSEMAAIEVIADEFGSSWKTELCYNDGLQPLQEEDVSSSGTSTPFWRLEQLSCDIDELDYIVTTDQIDICNQSLAKILAGSDKERMSKEDETMYADLDRTTWSILVSRLKILWTLEIRDCIMAISKDLIFVIGYMKSQVRQMHTLADRDATSTDGRQLSTTPMNLNESFDFSVANSVGQDSQDGLQYLLRRDSSWGVYSDVSGTQEDDERNQHFEAEETGNSTLPTLDIHFSNPQVQLHSKSTGGSVILAMEGAHVEGKKFVKFLVANNHNGKMSPADLIRKTEHIYTLTNMEAYSLSSQIDIGVGLPWLEVDAPAPVERNLPEPTRLGVLFGISSPRQAEVKNFSERDSSTSLDGENMSAADNYEWKYPPELRHHEPFAFREQKNIRPILNKFTCLSRQLFYRPPIHYSNEELKSFISQGLVIEQSGTIADNIDLEIDLLQFNLDSYQFKTTIDLIRNVLLKPPKPHRRSQNLVQLDKEEDADTRSNRISSPEVFEMESALWAARARRASGKKERAALRSPAMKLIEDLERRVEVYGDQMIRRVSYKLSKLVWCVQSQGQIDDVQIAFTGFQGEHSYMASGALKTQISLEDVRVTSPKPGPDSMSFPDPTSVLKPVLGSKRSPCQRCGSTFSHSINGLEACRFHLGRFREGKWSCCQATTSNAPGCKTAPHSGKERTAVVRVETLPPVVEGISLYSHLEVNIFPSVPHTLSVQISKSVSRLFMDYFFIGQDDDDDDDDTQSISTDVTGSTDVMSVRSDSTPSQTARRKSLLIGGKGIGISNQPIKEEISRNDSYDQEEQRQLREQQQQQLNETFFFKVLRVGYVNVEVTLGGFRALPQTTLNICVRDYTKAYKIGSSAYLGQKYLYYLIHEVLKSGASSALRRKKMTTSAVADTDTDGKKEENNVQAERKLMPAVSPSRAARRAAAESRTVGVEDIIGSPIKKSAKKKRRLFIRRSNF